MASQDPDNRRRFSRVLFDAPCSLHCQDNTWTSELLDISLRGVLVRRPEGWKAPLTSPFEITIDLDEHASGIVLAVELRHTEADQLGFEIRYIDLDSATHLRRLVELNLGDQSLLERELSQLVSD